MQPPCCCSMAYISSSRGLRIVMRNADLLSGLCKPIIDGINLQRYSIYAAVAPVPSSGMSRCPLIPHSKVQPTLSWLSPRVARCMRPHGTAGTPSITVRQLLHPHDRPCCLPLVTHREQVQNWLQVVGLMADDQSDATGCACEAADVLAAAAKASSWRAAIRGIAPGRGSVTVACKRLCELCKCISGNGQPRNAHCCCILCFLPHAMQANRLPCMLTCAKVWRATDDGRVDRELLAAA